MKCYLLCCGQRIPRFIEEGYADFQKRLPKHLNPTLIELPTVKASSVESTRTEEGRLFLKSIPTDSIVVTLDERGASLTTKAFAEHLNGWCQSGRDLCFVIGGPYGLDVTVQERSDFCWSLSKLTFPHQLVKLIFIEQLYRAHTILTNHPYHHD